MIGMPGGRASPPRYEDHGVPPVPVPHATHRIRGVNLRRSPLAAFVALLAVIAACGDDATPPTEAPVPTSATVTTPSTVASTAPLPPTTGPVLDPDGPSAPTTTTPVLGPFEIRTSDGLILEAERFGTGADFVVLAHMRPADMTSWYSFAQFLADEGYSVITFNFRGYGNSEGAGFAVDVDVVAAVDAAVSLGAERVFVIGASMGGTGAIAAAAQRDLAGVITLSAPAAFQGTDAAAAAARIETALLLIASANDSPYNGDAETLGAAAGDTARVILYPGRKHGTEIFLDHSEEMTQEILGFLAAQP